MSSYYPSFTYMGINSLEDKRLIVVAFDADQGEIDTFLGMDCIYTESPYGTRRLDYGAKYNAVAVVKISVIKSDHSDFTTADVRDFLRWTTGVRTNSYLDLVLDGEVKYSFLGRVTNAYQQKLDGRTIGLTIEFTSVSPWAYSPEHSVVCDFSEMLSVDENGLLYTDDSSKSLILNYDDTLCSSAVFDITNEGVVYIDNSIVISIDNKTDDLYSFVYMKTECTSYSSNHISIKNLTLDEETIITDISSGDVITLDSNQMITSKSPNKIFGDTFNFIWPRLQPGINEFCISGSGKGCVQFTYRYPIKIGDCAIDVDVSNADIECGYSPNNPGGSTVEGFVPWSQVIDTPTTIEGYGITDSYNKREVNTKINNILIPDTNIDEQKLDDALTHLFGV